MNQQFYSLQFGKHCKCSPYASQTQLYFDTKHAYMGCGFYKGVHTYTTVLNYQFSEAQCSLRGWSKLEVLLIRELGLDTKIYSI